MSKFNSVEIYKDKAALMEIARQTAINLKDRGIDIPEINSEVVATICYDFLKTSMDVIADTVEPESDVLLDLFGIMEIGASHSVFLSDENFGNIVPVATPGKKFKDIMNSAGASPTINPGVAFKMAAKNDDLSTKIHETRR